MKTLKIVMSILFAFIGIFSASAIIATTGLHPIASVLVAVGLALLMETVKRYSSLGYSYTTVCGEISGNILNSCDFPLQSGTRDRAVIVNYSDIENSTINYAADGFTVESIILPSGAMAWQIDGKNNSIRPTTAMVIQGPNKMFDHMVAMTGFNIEPATKNQLNAMKDGKFVVITENYFRGPAGNSAFEIYGLTTGLNMTVIERDPNNQDTQGAFSFTFATELNKEPKLPNSVFDTSYTVTKAFVDGLL